MASKDDASLRALPPATFKGGTSEILNWITVAGAMEPLPMTIADYVPAYARRPAQGWRWGSPTGRSEDWARFPPTSILPPWGRRPDGRPLTSCAGDGGRLEERQALEPPAEDDVGGGAKPVLQHRRVDLAEVGREAEVVLL